MILIDDREDRKGSGELIKPLKAAGYEVLKTRLEYGDVSFEGRGSGGKSVSVGIELKRLSDLQGSLRSGRLAGHQLPGLLGPEGIYDYAFLVVEGQYRADSTGHLMVFKGARKGWRPLPGGMTVAEMEKQILTLEMCVGIHIRFTTDRDATVRFIGLLYRWFTDTALDAHTSHLAIHQPTGVLPLSKRRQALCGIPGVGRKLSNVVESQFGSIRNAVNASVDDWAALESTDDKGRTRKLGTKVATQIVDFVTGEE